MRLAAIAVLAALAALPAAAQGPGLDEPERLAAELEANSPAIGAPFALRDAHGRLRRLADFRGKVVVLYFGYTFCPDVCPTDLANIARAMRDLGPAQKEVQPLFITLDPARDQPALLRKYAPAFHPRLIALRGSEAETRRIAREWRQFFRKAPGKTPGAYEIEHAAWTYVIDRRGRFREAVPPGTPARRMAEVFREAVEGTRPR